MSVMSKDIRSFFNVLSKKSSSETPHKATPLSVKKKPKRLIDSDDEDVIDETPEPPKPKIKKKVIVLSSDSEEEKINSGSKPITSKKHAISNSEESSKQKTKKTQANEKNPKLKPVDVNDVFKKTPIKQSKVELTKPVEVKINDVTPQKKSSKDKRKGNKNTELGIHRDDKFDQTLLDLDDDDIFEEANLDLLEKTATEALEDDEDKGKIPDSLQSKKLTSPETKKANSEPSGNERKRIRVNSQSETNTPKKKKIEHVDSGIDPGQEAHEKKRYSAMLYQRYLNRSGPKHHGMKELPNGKPDCLKNLCFMRTGVLDSLESEEFDSIVKKHGGRVVHAVSKKVNYIVVGEEPGPAKLAKAESYNIKKLSENELFDLILTKSGQEAKYCQNDASFTSDDVGIVSDVPSPIHENARGEEPIAKMEENDKKVQSENLASTSCQPTEAKQSQAVVQIMDAVSQLPLTEKYKPQDLKAIIGQQGESSNLYKLKRWLMNWHDNQNPEKRKTLVKPSPWSKAFDGAYYKCALLSGPPGVGKTTSATLVAKELGFDIVEFNASDTRSKKLLHEEVAQLLSTKTIAGFATGKSNVNNRRVLLMDEVDGMSGNQDRGGMQELIQLIKNSSIPIICMCNDRSHQKMRSLVVHCYDLRFNKPRMEQIRGAMMSIAFKEKIKINPKALGEIITGTGCDVRQTLNHLSLLASTGQQISFEEAQKEANASKKDTVIGPWEVCRTVFSKNEHKDMSIADKARLFFYDYSLGPLFVQENYLQLEVEGNWKRRLLCATLAADAISMGDIVDSKIRSGNNWALLETQAIYSSVLPGYYMSGNFVGQINFPGWLGKNSKKNKFRRLISELQIHTRTSASASQMAIKLDYLRPLRDAIITPLKKGSEGISEAVEVMKTYNLLREDVDNLIELCRWKRHDNPMSKINSKTKTAFTKAYNKQVTLLPYAPGSGVSKKKAAALDELVLDDEEAAQSDSDEEEDITKNAMIKVKKPTSKGKKSEEAGTSKKTESKKGKGKKK